MERSKSRRSMFGCFRVAFSPWWLIALGCLGFLAPVAHAQDVKVEFEGTIIGVCPGNFPYPDYLVPGFNCFGYEIDPEVSVGASFSGSYTLAKTNHDAVFPNPIDMQIYQVSATTGSIQIGTTSSLIGSEDPTYGTQVVQIVNNANAPALNWESFDAWWLLPLQSDAITGGDHYCQIFFGESGTLSNPPQRLDGLQYFVNDSLDWTIFLPGAQQYVNGSFQCFGKSSAYVAGPLNPLFVGEITSIHRLPACSDGIDNDGDGVVDFGADLGCDSPDDDSEKGTTTAGGWALVCDDGADNDGDGLIDYPNDPGCFSPAGYTESPACSDGLDNDTDGAADYPSDPECERAWDTSEVVPGAQCGIGFELVFALPPLMWLYRKRRG